MANGYRTLIHRAELSADEARRVTERIPGELIRGNACIHLQHPAAAPAAIVRELRRELACDVNPLPQGYAPDRVRLVVTDLDSTLITIECIDELADFAGKKAEVAAVTAAAMRGELDFAESLRRRVRVLAGLSTAVLQRVYDERLRLMPGAEALIAGCRARGIWTAVVSGGFTFFAERIQERLGLDFARANRLAVEDGRLKGEVEGEICGAEGKAAFLGELCQRLGIGTEQAIAVGDGANDLLMLSAAGLGIAFHAKPSVQERTAVAINHGGLDSILKLLDPRDP